jgi:hypothetical protein
MELQKLKRNYLRTQSLLEYDIYHKKEIGLGIALVKFDEFYHRFIQAQLSFQMGMRTDHRVYSTDGNNDLAQKSYRFYFLQYAILDYNACYDYLLQIVYFGCDFFDEIKSQKDYKENLKQCTWTCKKEKNGFKDRIDKLEQTRNDDFKAFLKKLCKFYGCKDNNKYPLAFWTNQIKHKGGFIIDELEPHGPKIEIINRITGEIVFSSDSVKPISTSLKKIEECLIYHNDKIVEFADFLYTGLNLDNPAKKSNEFSYTQAKIDTTDCVLHFTL